MEKASAGSAEGDIGMDQVGECGDWRGRQGGGRETFSQGGGVFDSQGGALSQECCA